MSEKVNREYIENLLIGFAKEVNLEVNLKWLVQASIEEIESNIQFLGQVIGLKRVVKYVEGDAEFSAEEQIKALWNEQEKVCDYANGIREGIKQTLRIHGIKYDWLDGAE